MFFDMYKGARCEYTCRDAFLPTGIHPGGGRCICEVNQLIHTTNIKGRVSQTPIAASKQPPPKEAVHNGVNEHFKCRLWLGLLGQLSKL